MNESRLGPKIFAAILCMAFGFGALWVTTHGIKVAFDASDFTQKGLMAQVSDAVSSDAETLSSSTDSLVGPATVEYSTLDATATAEINSSINATVNSLPKPSGSVDGSLTVLMGGDVMLDRKVRQLGVANGYDALFSGITSLLKSADVSVVNLEGTITSNPSKTLLANGSTTPDLIFTFAPETAAVLPRVGIDIVSLANNHSDNFGANGFSQTKGYLETAEVGYFGSPWNDPSTEKVVTKNGITVAFVGYHAFQPGFDRVIAAVKRLSAAGDFVIVMPHWGVEYSPKPTNDQKAKARALVAAGADAIIGSHPHVIESHEWIAGPGGIAVPVYYSLGNLLFDQYFSPEVMKGNMVRLTIGKHGSTYALDGLAVYETSLASRKGVTIDSGPIEAMK